MDAQVVRAQRDVILPHPAVPAWLPATFDGANTAVASFDEQGAVLYFNEPMKALSISLGHDDISFGHLSPVDRTTSASIEFERFRAGRTDRLRIAYQLRRANGQPYWADLSARRIVIEPDQTSLTLFQIVDITAEKEASFNEARWEAALGAARQGVWDHDTRRGTVTYSRMWRRMRGIGENEEVDGQRELWLERLHPEDRKRIESVVDKQAFGEDGYDILEYRERHRDGHYVWILSRGKPIEWDENGVAVRSVGTDTDITHIKAMEAELALEKERLSVTLQSIADGVISTDVSGRIIFMNTAAEKMTGWTSDEALGCPIETIYDSRLETDTNLSSGLMQKCLKRGTVVKAVDYALLKGKRGRSRYVREIASPVLGKDGAINGAVMVFRDATHRRKLMRELEYTASHDSLTGLSNRAAFETKLDASVASARPNQDNHALCLIDLDNFKSVNDSAGHAAGDALLVNVAKLLHASCRDGDFVARLGGDEFAIILDDCSLKTARAIAQEIVRKIAEMRFGWQGDTFRIGASVGIAAIDGTNDRALDFYRNADNACYAAKRNGRGCVVVFG